MRLIAPFLSIAAALGIGGFAIGQSMAEANPPTREYITDTVVCRMALNTASYMARLERDGYVPPVEE